MNKKRALISAVVVVVLAVLVYLQFREWRHFNWKIFWEQTGETRKLFLVNAVGLIYVSYLLRALRWKVFLRPVRHVPARRLISPTLIGFTGLALLGRPGEFARPYLIARRAELTVSSQIAVWAVERIFDIASFTVLLTVNIFSASDLPYVTQFRRAGFILIALVVAMTAAAVVVRRNTAGVAAWFERRCARFSPHLAHSVAHKVHAFGEGLNTIHDLGSFLQLTALSLGVWFSIALAYEQVTHAYPGPLQQMTVAHVILLIGFSMVGSLVQLPAIGGGSQLATIKGMQGVFDIRPELAVSCGIMLWLVTFMAVIPAGLILAHREHVSLTRISAEQEKEVEPEPAPGNP